MASTSCNCLNFLKTSPSLLSNSNVPCHRPSFSKCLKSVRLFPITQSKTVVNCSLKRSTSVIVSPPSLSSNSTEKITSTSTSTLSPSTSTLSPSTSSTSISSPASSSPVPIQPPNSIALSSSVVNSPSTNTQTDLITEPLILYEEDNSSGRTSFSEALLNSVNILLGVGLLSIPYALKQGGWGALGVLILLGIVTNYTGKLLGRIQSRVCLLSNKSHKDNFKFVKGLDSYEDIGEAAFGSIGRQFITLILYTELVGTCGLFFILEGDNFSRLFGGDPKFYMILSSLFLLPTTWLPDLSALAALGALGAMASSSLLAVLIISYFLEGFPAGSGHELIDFQNIPLTFGLLSFVYAGHAVFPSIQSSMKQPELYPKMLDYTYLIVASVCALVGVIGYQMYGENVREEIILNLPQGILAIGATILIVVNPFTKFALTMEPVARGVENLLTKFSFNSASNAPPHSSSQQSEHSTIELLSNGKNKIKNKNKKIDPILRVFSRTGLGLSALFLATSVPEFASVMALIGSCLTMLVSVIFPSAAFLAVSGNGISRSEKFWNYFIIATGCFCAIAGTYSALASIESRNILIL